MEPLLVAVGKVDPKKFKKTKEEQRKNESTAKRMHGQFARDMEDKVKNNEEDEDEDGREKVI